MTIERLLQIHIAVLVTLGTLLLSLGQQNSMYPMLIVFAVTTSILFTDILKWFQLNRTVANVAAIFALFFVADFFRRDRIPGEQLLSIANMLMYLQIVLLYQSKSPRVYGHLAVLSLLQVVVAAAFSVGLQFGVSLLLYMVAGFSTLMVFFIHRETLRIEDANAASPQPAAASPWKLALGRPPAVVLSQGRRGTRSLPEAMRATFTGWSVARQISVMTLSTMVFTAVLFYCTPRVGSNPWQGPHGRYRAKVGFSRTVSLNDMQQILQDPQPVMRIAFEDAEKQEPYAVLGDLYVHGAYLTEYGLHNGSYGWRSKSRRFDNRLQQYRYGHDDVRQIVTIEPTRSTDLFAVNPAYRVPETSKEVRYDPRIQQLYRGDEYGTQFKYVIGTDAFLRGIQRSIVPVMERSQYEDGVQWYHIEPTVKHVLGLHHDDRGPELLRPFDTPNNRRREALRFENLIRVSEQVLAEHGAQNADRYTKAEHLRRHFVFDGGYQYTLDYRDLQRNPNLDPIEDFVANLRQGHCEYYASALALMLRWHDIPSRVVVGYKGGEFNSMGNYYQFRQLHAHAWVEAFLRKEDIPEDWFAGPEPPGLVGGWLRLDPTPYSESIDAREEDEPSVFARVEEMLDYAELLWNDYVMGLNPQRQQDTIFEPMSVRTEDTLASIAASPQWQAWRQWLARVVGVKLNEGESLTWAMLRKLRIAAFVVAGIYLTWRLSRLVALRGRERRNQHSQPHSTVDFYRQLELLLARLGLQRRPGQTQREFASAVEQQEGLSPAMDMHLRRITDAFYRVRFGGASLDKDETQAIQHALTFVEAQLADVQPARQDDAPQRL